MVIWEDILGYEGLYRISSSGDVFSVVSNKILKPVKSSTGYYHVSLYLNHKVRSFNVHVLVADAFIPLKDECPEINHIDGNKGNNAVYNLERVSRRDNVRHAIKLNLRRKSPMEGRTGISNPKSVEIVQYSLDGKYVRSWVGISEAARNMGCSSSTISGCLQGRKKTAKGFIWRYKTSDSPPLSIDIETAKRTYPTGRKWKQINRRNMRRIRQMTISGELVRIWDNYIELTNETGFNNGNIYKCINRKLKSAYGYTWEYDTP